MQQVKALTEFDSKSVASYIDSEHNPVVFKNLAKHWKSVSLAKESNETLQSYLLELSQAIPVSVGEIPAEHEGRLFYTDSLTSFNFNRKSASFSEFIERVNEANFHHSGEGIYLGSTSIHQLLPDFSKNNALDIFEDKNPLASIWLNNKTRIAAHQDLPNNIAVCVSGKRKFTLFPPNQLENLYIGPLDLTPAGQPISLVDINFPDFERFPKYKQALQHAQTVILEPGDALFIPSMWWHAVEGMEDFNTLVNYWWQDAPNYAGAPVDSLLHAMLNIRSLTKQQRDAIKTLFDYYVFNDSQAAAEHIPDLAKGILEDSELSARKIRAMLINKLNR